MNYTSYTSNIHAWLEKHPIIGLPMHIITFLFHYLTSFKWVIDLVRWMITTGGNIAESAFLLATVYVTTNTVAHLLVTWILPDQVISMLNQVSTMAFSVLPELIIASAMKTTLDHWKLVWRTKRIDAWIWACSYTVPTIVFLVMTILTICTFVNFEAVHVTPPQATGDMLVTRCLAGWGYGMVQILFVSIGKQGYVDVLDSLQAQVHTRDEALTSYEKTVSTLQEEVAQLQDQVTTQEQELFNAQMALATRRMTGAQNPVRFPKRGKEGTAPRSAVRLLKKDEGDTGNKSALHEDVNKDVESDLDEDVNSDVNKDHTGNKSALHEDVNSELMEEQTAHSTAHKSAFKSDVGRDVNRDLYEDADRDIYSEQIRNTAALNRDVDKDLNKDVESEENSEQTVHEDASNMVRQSAQQRELKGEQMKDQTAHSEVNRTANKTKAGESEAAKKIQRILRRNPNTGPTELAAKTGVSRRYASQVKSQFLAELAAEQSA